MSDQTNIFGGAPAATLDKGNVPPTDTNPSDPLAVLVGEGRKYKTPQDLGKAYLEADGFIEKLKEENRLLREKAARAATLEEVLGKLQPVATPAVETPPASGTPSTPISAADVAAMVKEQLTGLETARTRQNNLQKADAEMRKLYGDKAQEVFAQRAPDAATKKVLEDLAAVNPDSFLALFKTQTSGVNTIHSTISTAHLAGAVTNRQDTPGTKEYYNKVRRENARLYYSTDFQTAMNKAAASNPQLYFGDGEFDTSLGR